MLVSFRKALFVAWCAWIGTLVSFAGVARVSAARDQHRIRVRWNADDTQRYRLSAWLNFRDLQRKRL
jgi:hypothetical protein